MPRLRTPLDRAIVASIAAMAAMNLFVLANQLHAEPRLATANTEVSQA